MKTKRQLRLLLVDEDGTLCKDWNTNDDRVLFDEFAKLLEDVFEGLTAQSIQIVLEQRSGEEV